MFPVDVFRNTVERFVAILHKHAVPFHLTGGVTSVAWGEPRMTQDIDFVVGNPQLAVALGPFLVSLADSVFMHDERSIRDALARGGMFQLMDTIESLKLDVYARELVSGELQRSEPMEIFAGVILPVASRADVAASKLIWIGKGSHKSRRDLRKLFQYAPGNDQQAIRDFAESQGLSELLDTVLNEPDEIDR